MAETRGSEVLVIWRLTCTKGTVPHLSSYHPAKLLPKVNAGSIISKKIIGPECDSTVQLTRSRHSSTTDRHQEYFFQDQVTPSSHACQLMAESLCRTEDILGQNFLFLHTTGPLLVV